jgi:hypothetical protein
MHDCLYPKLRLRAQRAMHNTIFQWNAYVHDKFILCSITIRTQFSKFNVESFKINLKRFNLLINEIILY